MDKLRRNNLTTQIPAEKAVGIAIQEVEKLGASESLTEMVLILTRVKEMIGDYVDKRDMVRCFDELSDKQRKLDKSMPLSTPDDGDSDFNREFKKYIGSKHILP